MAELQLALDKARFRAEGHMPERYSVPVFDPAYVHRENLHDDKNFGDVSCFNHGNEHCNHGRQHDDHGKDPEYVHGGNLHDDESLCEVGRFDHGKGFDHGRKHYDHGKDSEYVCSW